MTHYLPAFVAANGRLQQAACGEWIRREEHTADPSCPGCRRFLDEDVRTVEELFGTPEPSQLVPVRPDPDPVGEWTAYMRRIEARRK